MYETIEISGSFEYESYRAQKITYKLIDATDANWIVSNSGENTNRYPVSIYDSSDVTLIGGEILGEVPQNIDWIDAYVNSAAILVRGTDGAVVQDWRISRAWDGIRILGNDDDTFTIENIWLSEIRDDGVENDQGVGGTIRNALFDGVFVGVSIADENMGDKSDNVVMVEDVLIRMKEYLYKGELTHQAPFKTLDTSPQLEIHDSVFAIEDGIHRGWQDLERAWDKVIDASGNYFLNLSDETLPENYPRPPEGFTILEGAEARNYWAATKAEWIARSSESIPAQTPALAADSDEAAEPDPLAAYVIDDIVLQDQSRIAGWSDSSGNGNDLVASGNPTFADQTTPTGRGAVVFDGSGDLLDRNGALNGRPEGNGDRTMFFVVNYLDHNGVTSGLVYGDGVQNQTFDLTTSYNSETLSVQGWGLENDFGTMTDGPSQDWIVQSAVLEDGTLSQYLDGKLIDTTAHVYATDAERIVMGAEIAELGESRMGVAAGLIYDRALSDGERLNVETMLQSTYIEDDFVFVG
ncbi:hypothetical protein LX81_04299 [Palleronia aestuarii]|uniref:Concanavalin A-like lectin/glucanase superfamily protein n=1 Tax=Palleronia aestuarii TaxID=568105 RepID=A0A2W7NAX3_9RHOB|nr:hypothetical protein [Palleronia aestuarii]PZX10156.1 hypothetical protein LX81_04299 [Palleronia aestuarii]